MKIYHSRAQCKLCKDIIESKTTHDFVQCSCKSIAVDGGKDYLKRCYTKENIIIELSEYEKEE